MLVLVKYYREHETLLVCGDVQLLATTQRMLVILDSRDLEYSHVIFQKNTQ